MKQLDEIRGRLEEATPGPWEKDAHGTAKLDSIVFKAYSDKPGGWIEVARSYGADTEFIANAPTDVTRLLNAVQAMLDLADQLDAEATASVNVAKEIMENDPKKGWILVAGKHEHHAEVARNHAARIREAITFALEVGHDRQH